MSNTTKSPNWNEIDSATREIVADIVLKFNFIEHYLDKIISSYITETVSSSDRIVNDFLPRILLHSSIIAFNSKFQVVLVLVREANLSESNDWKTAVRLLMRIRNQVVHSQSIFKPKWSFSPDESDQAPEAVNDVFFDFPDIPIIQENKYSETSLITLKSTFDKYYEIALNALNSFESQIFNKNYEKLKSKYEFELNKLRSHNYDLRNVNENEIK